MCATESIDIILVILKSCENHNIDPLFCKVIALYKFRGIDIMTL